MSATSQQAVAVVTSVQRIVRRPPVRRAAQMLTPPSAMRIAAPTPCRTWIPQVVTSSSTNAATDQARSATVSPIAAITCRRRRGGDANDSVTVAAVVGVATSFKVGIRSGRGDPSRCGGGARGGRGVFLLGGGAKTTGPRGGGGPAPTGGG